MKNLLYVLLLVSGSFNSFSQTKYWVIFTDKAENAPFCISEETIKNRSLQKIPVYQQTDKAVNESYISKISEISNPIITSRWLNAVSVLLSNEEKEKISRFEFVEKIIPVSSSIVTKINTDDNQQKYAFVQEQINSKVFKDNSAQNITIGVIDAGFYNAHKDEDLKLIFDNKHVKQYRDYVSPLKIGFYSIPETPLDNHGTTVLQQIAGYNALENKIYGCAYNASFYLARTDHGTKENRREEDYWVAAMEWMDSLGVRLINTSLGYAQGFDMLEENYKTNEMTGKISVIARAAQIATEQKGIVLVVSAGNEGTNASWRIISTPADAPGVLSVGATIKNRQKANYSSIGPEYNDYLKPEVSCYSMTGTSFSAPVITGIAACIMNTNPELKSEKIKEIIMQSAHLYPYGNNYIGYGIPNCQKIIDNLMGKELLIEPLLEINANKAVIEVDKGTEIVIYHKKNQHYVVSTDKIKAKKKKLTIDKPNDIKFTTLDMGNKVIEIEWK